MFISKFANGCHQEYQNITTPIQFHFYECLLTFAIAMGGKQSTSTASPQARTLSTTSRNGSGLVEAASGLGLLRAESSSSRQRARSLTAVANGQGISIPPGGGNLGALENTDSENSTPDDGGPLARVLSAHSLPTHFWSFNGLKCPVCAKFVMPDDIECHLVMCLTKPRISYNEDILGEDKGECVICLEELNRGDTIARLPCLCIYHKTCIDTWFEVNRSCPEHPSC